MVIIPVIDILNGEAVHAKRGLRDNYTAVRSVLCKSSNPVEIAQAYLDFHPFDRIYIADLNAISNRGNNTSIINQLKNEFPGIRFWLDNGASNQQDLNQMVLQNTIIVMGSETNISPNLLNSLRIKYPNIALSLDFRDGRFLGDQSLWDTPEAWPDKVILMNLDRVGTGSGFDEVLIGALFHKKQPKELYLAGGIQSMEELMTLKHKGIEGVLMATALHSGVLRNRQIRELYDE